MSLADLLRSPCILPAAEKTRSTPADDAGAAKYWLLLDHLRQVRPLALLRLPPIEHLDVEVRLLGIGQVLLSSSSRVALGKESARYIRRPQWKLHSGHVSQSQPPKKGVRTYLVA